MIQVICNTFCIFKRNKEFIYLITIQPLLIFLLMSFLLPYSKTHNVAVADFTENAAVSQALEKMEGIKAVTVSEDAITEKLINGSVSLQSLSMRTVLHRLSALAHQKLKVQSRFVWKMLYPKKALWSK